MNPRARELARAILAGCAKTDETHELARAVLVAQDLPPYPDDLRAEIDRLERSAAGGAGSAAPVQGSWRMGIREAVSALRPYLSGMQAEIERLRAEVATGEQIMAQWKPVLDALPCPVHGSPCAPGALDRIAETRTLGPVRRGCLPDPDVRGEPCDDCGTSTCTPGESPGRV